MYAPEETEGKDYTVIIIVCCVLGAVIIIAIIIIVLYLKVFRKPRPPTPEPPKIRKKRRKPSIIDYSPRVLNRSSSVEKTDELPCKMSAEEILSGVSDEKRQSNLSLDNLNAYEPPKKEVHTLDFLLFIVLSLNSNSSYALTVINFRIKRISVYFSMVVRCVKT